MLYFRCLHPTHFVRQQRCHSSLSLSLSRRLQQRNRLLNDYERLVFPSQSYTTASFIGPSISARPIGSETIVRWFSVQQKRKAQHNSKPKIKDSEAVLINKKIPFEKMRVVYKDAETNEVRYNQYELYVSCYNVMNDPNSYDRVNGKSWKSLKRYS